MRDVLINIIGHDRASPAFAAAAASADRAAGKMGAASARMSKAGAAMTRHLTVPIVAIAAVSAKMATDFSSAMTRVQTQAGGSARDVQLLSKQVLDLAKYAQQGPKELADSLYHLKSVGMDNVTAMKALRQASDLAAVGHANLEETTNALAGAWRTGIKGAGDFHQAVATLNAIIGSGNMSMEDLNAALGTGILPAAKTFGLTLKDVGAALALFTDEGVPADAAATRLRMTFSLMATPTQQAAKSLKALGLSGAQVTARTKGMTELLGKAHVTTTKLAEDMRQPNGLLVATRDLAKHLKDSGLSASAQASVLSRAFGGGRSSAAIMSMVNNVGVLGQKYAQTGALIGKYNAAVAAQRKTPAAQFALLVSSLQRSAILIGNQVLPMLVKLAQKVGSVIEWFNGMSSSTRRSIIGFALVVAAVGPAVAILARLVRAAMLVRAGMIAMGTGVVGVMRLTQGIRAAEVSIAAMETRSYGAGLKIRAVFLSLATAAGNFGSYVSRSMAGAAASLRGVPAAMGAASGLGGKLGAIGAGAAGALRSIGPLALGIAGAGIIISKVVGAWESYRAHQQAVKQATESLTQAIIADNGALGANTRAQVANMLQSKGAFDAALKLGIGQRTLTDAFLGSKGAQQQLNTAMDYAKTKNGPQVGAITALHKVTGDLTTELNGAKTAAANYSAAMNTTAGAVKGTATGTADLRNSLRSTYNQQIPAAAQATHSLADASDHLKVSLAEAALSGKKLVDALNALDGGALSAAQANVSFRQAALGLKDATDQQYKSIRGTTNAALNNKSALLGALQSVKDLASAQASAGRSGDSVAASLKSNIAWLETMAVKAGFNRDQVDALVRSMHLVPSNINSKLHVDTGTSVADLQSVKYWMDLLHDKTVAINIVRHGAAINGSGQASGPGFARGGTIPPNTTFTVGEGASHTWEGGVSDSAGRVTIFSNRQSKALGYRTPHAYAKGSKPDQGTLSSNVSTSIGNIGSAYSPKFSVPDIGIGRIRKQIADAWKVLQEQIGKGLSKHAASAYRKELRDYTRQANRQLASLKVKIRTTDLSGIRKAISGSADDLRAAFSQMISDARRAGYTTKQVQALQNREATLLTKQASLTQNQDRLSGMKDYRSNVRSTLAGSFDSTQYGSIQDLTNGFSSATGSNNKFATQVNSLRKRAKGNKGLLAYINQLEQSGNTTTLDTLYHANASQLTQVSRSVSGYNTSLNAGSDAATTSQYGESVAHQAQDVAALKTSIGHLVDGLNKPKPVHVHVHLNGKEIGTSVVHSKAFHHEVLDALADLNHYGRKG